jgi:Zinc finger, C3HC4 type (RING finger)
MFLQLTSESPQDLEIQETDKGTFVFSNSESIGQDFIIVEPLNGITIRGNDGKCNTNRSQNGFFVPFHFRELKLNCNQRKVRLKGIKDGEYKVSVSGSHNQVVFGENRQLDCVVWEESGNRNILDVSQQDNTYTQGMFSPTTNLITKTPFHPYCNICQTETPANVLLQPCGHIAMCLDCCEIALSNSRSCPLCRLTVQSVHRIYAVT